MSNEKALIQRDQEINVDGTALEIYSGRAEVRELALRLMRLHPAASEVGDAGMLATAQLALMVGANPLPGTNEIHVWKHGHRTVINLGVNYHRRKGKEAGGWLWQIKPRRMTPEESRDYGVEDNQVGAICAGVRKEDMIGMRSAGFKVAEVWDMAGEIGTGTVGNHEELKKGRTRLWTAQKRCETDLLRKLFPNLEARKEGGEDWERSIVFTNGDNQDDPEAVLQRNRALLWGDDDQDPFALADSPAPVVEVVAESAVGIVLEGLKAAGESPEKAVESPTDRGPDWNQVDELEARGDALQYMGTETEPLPAAKGGPKRKRPKVASVRSSGWKEAAIALSMEEPYYRKEGKTDWYHLTGAAGKLGYQTITDDNLTEVIAALREYAEINQAAQGDDAEPEAAQDELPF